MKNNPAQMDWLDEDKPKAQLIAELQAMRQKLAALHELHRQMVNCAWSGKQYIIPLQGFNDLISQHYGKQDAQKMRYYIDLMKVSSEEAMKAFRELCRLLGAAWRETENVATVETNTFTEPEEYLNRKMKA
jgi:hypothetical protein